MQNEHHAGGARTGSGFFQHQQLRLSYVCTSATAAFAFDAFDAYSPQRITQTKQLRWQVSHRRPRLHSVMPVCKQPAATLALHKKTITFSQF